MSEVPAKKLKIRDFKEELNELSKEDLIIKILKQHNKIEKLVKLSSGANLESFEKLKNQLAESTNNENILVLRLTAKDQETQELISQIQDYKSQTPSATKCQQMLLDPAVNLMFQQMKAEMDTLKGKLEQAQKDLAAWKFSPDSQAGKRLMAKCRMLLQENEELGKTVSSGKIAKLEGDIALQKKLIAEMKRNEKETENLLAVMDEDTEAMQGTIYLLQHELKETREQLQKLEAQQNEITLALEKQQEMFTIHTNCQGKLAINNDESLDKSDDLKMECQNFDEIDDSIELSMKRQNNLNSLNHCSDSENDLDVTQNDKYSISKPLFLSPQKCNNNSSESSQRECRENFIAEKINGIKQEDKHTNLNKVKNEKDIEYPGKFDLKNSTKDNMKGHVKTESYKNSSSNSDNNKKKSDNYTKKSTSFKGELKNKNHEESKQIDKSSSEKRKRHNEDNYYESKITKTEGKNTTQHINKETNHQDSDFEHTKDYRGKGECIKSLHDNTNDNRKYNDRHNNKYSDKYIDKYDNEKSDRTKGEHRNLKEKIITNNKLQKSNGDPYLVSSDEYHYSSAVSRTTNGYYDDDIETRVGSGGPRTGRDGTDLSYSKKNYYKDEDKRSRRTERND